MLTSIARPTSSHFLSLHSQHRPTLHRHPGEESNRTLAGGVGGARPTSMASHYSPSLVLWRVVGSATAWSPRPPPSGWSSFPRHPSNAFFDAVHAESKRTLWWTPRFVRLPDRIVRFCHDTPTNIRTQCKGIARTDTHRLCRGLNTSQPYPTYEPRPLSTH